MRYGIVADIHSNLEAFTAVLKDIEGKGGVDQVWCLGDIVGYGPEPHACLELLRQHDHVCIAGNHDWAAIYRIDTSEFNPDAAAAALWTAGQLSDEDVSYLESLPLTLETEGFTLAHGSPKEQIWEYLLSPLSAQASFDQFPFKYCLVGHSHIPLVFEETRPGECVLGELPTDGQLVLGEHRLIINPGGVGQPRDNDPRASYAILDSERQKLYHFRISYDVATTQQKMLKLGLPPRLAERLSRGW